MKRVISSSVVKASTMSPSASRAVNEVYSAVRNLYDVMSRYEDNIEQILNDPNFYDATMDEVRYLESVLGTVEGSSQPSSTLNKLKSARSILQKYSTDQVKFVQECFDEVCSIASDSFDTEDTDEIVGRRMDECINDYAATAVEDGLLTDNEFDELYNAVATIGDEEAAAYS